VNAFQAAVDCGESVRQGAGRTLKIDQMFNKKAHFTGLWRTILAKRRILSR
jgi:hypothetical protein